MATDGKLKRVMELANKLAARQVLIVGDDEIASGEYTLKDMQSGAQKKVGRDELLDMLKHAEACPTGNEN